MEKRYLYILLSIIKTNGDIRKLKREGVDYKAIAELTQLAISDNLVDYKDDIIALSEKGKVKLKELENRYKIINKHLWIEEEKKSRIPKLSKDFVFLPNQNEIHFESE